MANTIRIKRRASGNAGAPSSLANAELAYNEVDDVLYYGKGTGGVGGTATTIPAIAGPGAFMTLSTNQAITGTKNFTGATITVPTKSSGDNSTNAASTAYVDSAVGAVVSSFTVAGNTGSYTFKTGSTLNISGDGTIVTSTATQPSGNNVNLALSINNSSITNAKLVNNSLTIGTTPIALGATSTTLGGVGTYGIRDTSAAFDVQVGATSSTTLTANRELTFDVKNAARTISLGGNLSLGANLTTDSNAISFSTSGSTSLTLPSSGTLATLAGTETLQNKTVGSGSTWNGNTVGVAYGGTGTTNGSITGTGALTFTAGGTNTNINLVPNGTGTVDVASARITNLNLPLTSTDAANKAYVDSIAQSLNVHGSVNYATTGSVAYTYTSGGTALTITTITNTDTITFSNNHGLYINSQIRTGNTTTGTGLAANTTYYVTSIPAYNQVKVSSTYGGANVTLTNGSGLSIGVTGDPGVGATLSGTPNVLDGSSTFVGGERILVKDHSTAAYNGVYSVTTVGTGSNGVWTRTTDFDNGPTGEITAGDYVFVASGTINGSNGWMQTQFGPIKMGINAANYSAFTGDALSFTQFSGAGQIIAGAGLTKSGNTIDVNGTANRITVNSDNVDIASTYVGQTSITTLGSIATGTWTADVIAGQYGGTGVANTGKTITLGGNINTASSFTTSGAFALTLTTTASTNVTLPTTGTLATLAGSETLTNKTLTSPVISTISNTGTLTLPTSTDTLVGRATTDTFTNKTFDTAGSGNVFKINGTTISATTGSDAVVLATSPTLVTPTLGAATATTVNKVTITTPATGSTLTIADGKTLTASNTLTFTGTDGSSVAFGGGGTVLYNGGALGTPSSGTLTNCTGLPISTGVSGLGSNVATFLATPTSANLATVVTDKTGSAGSLVFSNTPSLTTPALSGATVSTSATVSATGTTQATATALTSDYNVITTVTANSGVALPTATVGRKVIVINKGANPLNIYPATGGAIDALATNAALTIPVNGFVEFDAASTTLWYSSVNTSVVGSSSLVTTGTVTTGTWSASFGAVSGANLTNLTAGNLTGTIPSTVLGNSTIYIGTTGIALNRASGSLALTGITSIDGSASSVANSLTFNNSGTGAASGTTFNGSAAQTISYNTVGASPLAGSSSLTTTGTVTSGTWSSGLSGETFSTSATVSAAGTTQGTATALTSDYNVITTVAANTGVTLPTATTGRRVIIVNRGANSLNVYPASGASIDELAANAAMSLPSNGYMEFNASSTTQWYSSYNATVTGTGVTSFSAGTTGLTPNSATTGAITLAGTLNAANGGTGLSSYSIGDLIYASASTTLAKLAAVATGNVLISQGTGTAPAWGKVDLTSSVSNTLPVSNGGTGATTFTSKGIIYGNSGSALQVTAAAGTSDATTSNQLLTVDGTGTPVWTTTIDGGTF